MRRLAILVAALVFAGAAEAATPADFYKGRTVQLLVGFSPGGGYDLYGRVLARHIGRHIPGVPIVVAQNMPGAGSVKAANYIYNVAPKDGTVFGIFDRGLAMERLLGRSEGQNFDTTKFTWIGSVTDEPAVLANMFHLPVRIVSGYPGRAETVLSVQRGEIDGLCGWSWSSLMSRDRRLYDSGAIVVALQLGMEKTPGLPNVPALGELTMDPKEKAALRLIFSRLVIARPFAAPPGLSPERAKILRDAFDATMKDPAFLAEMQRLALEVRPQTAAKIEQVLREVYAAPPDVVKRAAAAIKRMR